MFEKFFKKTKEKVDTTLDSAQVAVNKASKVLKNGDETLDAIKVLGGIGFALIAVASITTIIFNIRGLKALKDPKIINNIYTYKKEGI